MQTIEMVTFKLNSEADEKAFLSANEPMAEWLAQQPGFEYRSLSKKEDGQWVDIVYWQTAEEAQSAGAAFMETPACKAMLSHVNPESVTMEHMPVLSSLCNEGMKVSA